MAGAERIAPREGDVNVARMVDQELSAIAARLIDIRRNIHANPELAFEETRTSALVAETLEKAGIAVQAGLGGTGVVGLISGTGEGNSAPSKTVMVRADIDALPIQEDTDLSFASTVAGKSHACGHDIHTATLLGVGMVMHRLRDRFSGNVKLVFQPAEEILAGARKMIDAGVLESPDVDFVVGYHVWPQLDVGQIGYYPGCAMASADRFELTIKGKAGHVAHPHLAIDPIVAAAQFLTAVQTVVSREAKPLAPVVLTIAQISGGHAWNVIPNAVELTGTLRTLEPETREKCHAAVIRILKGMTEAFRCEYELHWDELVPVLENSPVLLDTALVRLSAVLGPENVKALPEPSMGSDDFACYAALRPALHLRVGTRAPGAPITPLHSPSFLASDDAIAVAVKGIAPVVMDMLRLEGTS